MQEFLSELSGFWASLQSAWHLWRQFWTARWLIWANSSTCSLASSQRNLILWHPQSFMDSLPAPWDYLFWQNRTNFGKHAGTLTSKIPERMMLSQKGNRFQNVAVRETHMSNEKRAPIYPKRCIIYSCLSREPIIHCEPYFPDGELLMPKPSTLRNWKKHVLPWKQKTQFEQGPWKITHFGGIKLDAKCFWGVCPKKIV